MENERAPEFVVPAGPGAWLVRIWAQPGARKSEPAGLYQGRLKLRLAAPAVDNKANEALAGWLAGRLGLKARQVTLVSGHASRGKTVRIECGAQPDWDKVARADSSQ